MRFFFGVCAIGFLIGTIGCATHNWKNLWARKANGPDDAIIARWEEQNQTNWSTERQSGGKAQGIESKSRDIERNLGYR